DRGALTRAGGPSPRDIADTGEDMVAADEARPRRGVGVETRRRSATDETPTHRPRPAAGSPVSARRPASPAARNAAEAVCRPDPGRRRVVELQLPGLDVAPVSLRDIDADVILLDFWGSWCRECQKSIEHHRDLQEQLGGRRVQVIGIACEKGAT